MTPRPPPKLVTELTKAQVRKLMQSQAKQHFKCSAAKVLAGLRSGQLPKTAAATNIAMLHSLLTDSHE